MLIPAVYFYEIHYLLSKRPLCAHWGLSNQHLHWGKVDPYVMTSEYLSNEAILSDYTTLPLAHEGWRAGILRWCESQGESHVVESRRYSGRELHTRRYTGGPLRVWQMDNCWRQRCKSLNYGRREHFSMWKTSIFFFKKLERWMATSSVWIL